MRQMWLATAFVACPGVTRGPTGDTAPGGFTLPDCSVCSADQLCLYTYDFDQTLKRTECVDYPAECAAEPTCTCVEGAEDSPCRDLGWEGGACSEIGGRPAVSCVSTLG